MMPSRPAPRLARPCASFILALVHLAATAGDLSGQATPVEPQALLEVHNRWRAEHRAPPLEWSEELARYARGWAEVLVSAHPGRLLHSEDGAGVRPEARALGYGGWGENLYWAGPLTWSDGRREPRTGLTAEEVVTSWASEERWYDFATGACAPEADPGCGHFTQVVWMATTHVGCGRAFGGDGAQVWVCSYDPAGNWDGEYRENVLRPQSGGSRARGR